MCLSLRIKSNTNVKNEWEKFLHVHVKQDIYVILS